MAVARAVVVRAQVIKRTCNRSAGESRPTSVRYSSESFRYWLPFFSMAARCTVRQCWTMGRGVSGPWSSVTTW